MSKKGHEGNLFENDDSRQNAQIRNWTPKLLLAQDELFYLKDVAEVLSLDQQKIIKQAGQLIRRGESPWHRMGAAQIWDQWIVRMRVFSQYYRRHFAPEIRPVEESWDGNALLGQKGVFYLNEVCRLIPFSPEQLRHQARRHPNARKEFGLFQDTQSHAFLVDMERFAPWIRRIWRGEHGE